MAGDDERTVVESEATKSGADGAEEQKSKGSSLLNNKLVLFGGIGLMAIVLGVGLSFFVIKPLIMDSESDAGEETAVEETNDKKESDKKNKSHKKPKKKSSGVYEQTVYTVNDIVINPAGTGGTRFLSVSFGFTLETPELVQEFEEKDVLIRDALITILSSKTIPQLSDPKQKEIIRYQIKKRISKLLETDDLSGVYYKDFVMQ